MSSAQTVNRMERRKLEFRDKITAAALKLFEQQGVAETSVASIIKEADIAHKTFFNHFPTKDHLLKHIACSYSDRAYQTFRDGFQQQSDPRKRVAYCLGHIARALARVNEHYKELLNLYLISGAASSSLQQQQRQQFRQLVQEIIDDAHARHLLKPGYEVDTLVDVVIGLCVSTLLAWSQEKDYPIVTKMDALIPYINNSIFIECNPISG